MKAPVVKAATLLIAVFVGLSVGQNTPQSREKSQQVSIPQVFRPPYRMLKTKQDYEHVKADVNVLKQRREAEIKNNRMTGGNPIILQPLSLLTLAAMGNTNFVSPGCEVKLLATINQPADFYTWTLVNNNPGVSSYLGSSTSQSVVITLNENFFGSGSYKVMCDAYIYSYVTPPYVIIPLTSNAVNVQFNGPPGGRLHAVSLNTNSVKGGNNGTDPVLTVTLDAPAPSCGQIVYLSTSDSGLAWIHGTGNFTIPAGQQSDSISWFVGTKNVIKNRDVNIIVDVRGDKGYANLTLKK